MESEWFSQLYRVVAMFRLIGNHAHLAFTSTGLISPLSNKHLKLIIVDLLQKHTHQHELNFMLNLGQKGKSQSNKYSLHVQFFLLLAQAYHSYCFVSRVPNIEKSWSLLNWLQAKTKLVIKLKIYILGLRGYILTKNWLKQTHGRQDQRRKKNETTCCHWSFYSFPNTSPWSSLQILINVTNRQ